MANNTPTHSGVIPVFYYKKKPKVVLITSRSSRKWVLPKGYIEGGQKPPETALQEAWEEAGLKGEIVGGPLGSYLHPKGHAEVRVLMYLMKVKEVMTAWPEDDFRKRRIESPGKTVSLVSIPGLKNLLRRCFEKGGTILSKL